MQHKLKAKKAVHSTIGHEQLLNLIFIMKQGWINF